MQIDDVTDTLEGARLLAFQSTAASEIRQFRGCTLSKMQMTGGHWAGIRGPRFRNSDTNSELPYFKNETPAYTDFIHIAHRPP